MNRSRFGIAPRDPGWIDSGRFLTALPAQLIAIYPHDECSSAENAYQSLTSSIMADMNRLPFADVVIQLWQETIEETGPIRPWAWWLIAASGLAGLLFVSLVSRLLSRPLPARL